MALASNLLPGSSGSGPETPSEAVWVNPGNATACDNVYTTTTLTLQRIQSATLAAEDYDVSALNPSAQLTGIEVHIQALLNQQTATLSDVYLRRLNARTGVNKGPAALSVSEIDYQFGADGDLWGSSFKTVGDFLDVGTGVEIIGSLTNPSTDVTISVDCMTLTCYFENQRPFIMRFGLSPRRATLPINRNQRTRI